MSDRRTKEDTILDEMLDRMAELVVQSQTGSELRNLAVAYSVLKDKQR